MIPFTLDDVSTKKAVAHRPFWLRVFASEEIEIEQVKETLMIEEKGEWSEKRPCGPMYLEVIEGDDEKKEIKYNPYWCQNPQYFINITQPTQLKVKSLN